MLKIYDTLESVPEAQRAGALETKDGKFAVEESATDVTGLTSALEKERERAKTEEKARKAAEKERDDLKRTAEAKEKGISEEALNEIRQKEELARKPILDENTALKAENTKLKLTDRVQALYLKFGGLPDRTEDAMDQLAKRTGLGDEGGIIFKDKDGKVTADSAETFFPKFKAEKPFYFAGTGASGSGGTGSEGTGGEEQPKPDPTRSAAQKASIAGAF